MLFKVGSAALKISIWLILIALILAAILSISSRTLVSNVDSFKSEIEQELADYGITGVAFENITGSWKGFHPLLKIKGASLSIPGRTEALSINQLELSVKLIPSLLQVDLKLESLHAHVEKLILVHDKQGQWLLNDIPLTSTDEDTTSQLDIYALFKRLPDFVNIDIQLTQIRDQLNDVDYLIQDSSLNSSRQEDQLSMAFVAQLPSALGQQLTLNLKGDASLQQVYLDARNLNLVRLLQLAGKKVSPVIKARISLQSWAELDHFSLSELINEASLTEVRLGEKTLPEEAISLSLKQKIDQNSESWRIHTVVDDLRKASRKFTGFESQLVFDKNGSKPAFWLSAIKLGEMRELFSDSLQDSSFSQALDGMAPDANLQQLVAELDLQQLERSLLGVDFSSLSSRPHRSIPGVKTISGRLIAREGDSQLQIDDSPMTVEFTSLFRAPLHFDEFSTTLRMTLQDSGLLVETDSLTLSNSDVKLQARAWMEATKDKPPFLSLRASYQDGKAGSTGKYLPVSIMPEKTVAWLDKSIKGGQIPEGGLMFHGRLQKLAQLDNNQSGEFHALFRVKDPDVSFLPEWPSARKGNGEVSFHNIGMDISFDNVQFASSTVDHVDLSIPNLLRSQLIIQGNTRSPAGAVVDTLEALPILNVVEDINRRKQHIGGVVDTHLELRIPLSSKVEEKLSIKARAELQDVELSIPEWMVEFKNVKGILAVDNANVSAPALDGLYYGDRASLVVTTNSEKNTTEFNLNGDLNSSNLAVLLPTYLQQPVKGISPWDIQVSVANNPSKLNTPILIHAESELSGTQLDFPQPFLVKSDEKRRITFDASISSANELNFKAALIDRVYSSGKLQLQNQSDDRLSVLQLNFDADEALQKKSGYHMTGHIDNLNLNDWDSYLKQYFKDSTDTSSILKQIQLVNLTVDDLIWANQRVKESKISIQNNGFYISGNIDSSLARGSIRMPYQVDNENPFTADLEYIRLQKSEIENDLTPEIEDMPNLLINSKIVSYESMEFSDFILRTQNSENVFDIKQLDFSRDGVALKSSGHWQYDDETDEHVSVFNIKIEGKQFGQVVSALGLAESIRNGEINFDGQIGWAGRLFDMNWPTLIGEVELKLKDGYLVNVDPGAGRLVGLMSFSALHKRLFLDFGDVLSEGMQFDEIKGLFKIKGETMTTTNASMDGASAVVKVSGTTNLREKTYDQSMIIIPRVGDTLPILGTLAAGSSVGWGLLLLQKIFKKPIDKSVEIEYKLSGSWEDPVIELTSKPEPVENLENNESDESS